MGGWKDACEHRNSTCDVFGRLVCGDCGKIHTDKGWLESPPVSLGTFEMPPDIVRIRELTAERDGLKAKLDAVSPAAAPGSVYVSTTRWDEFIAENKQLKRDNERLRAELAAEKREKLSWMSSSAIHCATLERVEALLPGWHKEGEYEDAAEGCAQELEAALKSCDACESESVPKAAAVDTSRESK